MIPNTSAVFIKELGEIVVWIALVLYFVLLPVILKRIMFQKMTEASAVPLITILTAPGSLCLAGYLSVFKEGSAFICSFDAGIVPSNLFLRGILHEKKMLEVGFYPSYAAFTFPLVISATAMFKSSILYGSPNFIWRTELLSIVETVLAIAMVCYVLLKYFVHLYSQTKSLIADHEC